MAKVFCKDCSYFVLACYDDYAAYEDYCRAPTGKIITNYIYGHYKERFHLSPKDEGYPNKKDNNGCTYYKRKWWKYWVK